MEGHNQSNNKDSNNKVSKTPSYELKKQKFLNSGALKAFLQKKNKKPKARDLDSLRKVISQVTSS